MMGIKITQIINTEKVIFIIKIPSFDLCFYKMIQDIGFLDCVW